MTRRQLTGKQEQLIEPFLPMGEHGPNPEQLREQFEGGDLAVPHQQSAAGNAGPVRPVADGLPGGGTGN
ncbi:hypothetical protein [Streptomyces sp. Ag82_O1-15]|uniref:hypothetical protein n=1 Tax=Streptomyces sp. Ag82_O1-15 TaxID=1938855 RepID=UPI00117C8B06